MINPSHNQPPLLTLTTPPRSQTGSGFNTPRISGLPSLMTTPMHREISHPGCSPSHGNRTVQNSQLASRRGSAKDTVILKPPLESIQNEHFTNSHRESPSAGNQVRIKDQIPKLNMKRCENNQNCGLNGSESSRNPPKLMSLKDKMQTTSARSFKEAALLRDRSSSNNSKQDILAVIRRSSPQIFKEDDNIKFQHSKPPTQGNEKEGLQSNKLFVRSPVKHNTTRVSMKLRAPIPLKKVGSVKNVLPLNKNDKLSLKWVTPNMAELANICLRTDRGPTTPRLRADKSDNFERNLQALTTRKSSEQSPHSPDRLSLFSRAVQKCSEEQGETMLSEDLMKRSNSLPYHLPRKFARPNLMTELDNCSPSFQDEATTSNSPLEAQTIDDHLSSDPIVRQPRKSATFVENSESSRNSTIKSIKAFANGSPTLNLPLKRVGKQGIVVNPSSFRKTQEEHVSYSLQKTKTEEDFRVNFEELNDHHEKGSQREDDEEKELEQSRNIFNDSEFNFFELNTENVIIRKYIEGPGPELKLSKDFFKKFHQAKSNPGPKAKNNQAPLVLSYRDKHENIIIQPRYMQQYGSMSFTELWSGQHKNDYVKARKKDISVKKMEDSDAGDTIFRPDKKKSKLLIQKRIGLNRGDYSIRSSVVQEQITAAVSRISRPEQLATFEKDTDTESQYGEQTKLRGVIDPDDEESKDTSRILKRRAFKKATLFMPLE